jgi:hypothetical protein
VISPALHVPQVGLAQVFKQQALTVAGKTELAEEFLTNPVPQLKPVAPQV